MQADSIHSGSISFGRFENEPLSWERRSSFSHNKYLEEVEKCSKPGSVIEKKAYFEAHFKKRGLLGFNTSMSHDGSERTTSENEGSERLGNQEDFESNEDGHCVQFDRRSQEDFESNDDSHCVQFDQRSQEDFESNEDGRYIQFDQRSHEDFEAIDDGHFGQFDQRSLEDFERNQDGQFDEVPIGSDYHGECGVIGYEREDSFTDSPRVSFSNHFMESVVNNYKVLEDSIDNNIALDETQQPANETSSRLAVNDVAIIEVNKDHGDTVNSEENQFMDSAINNYKVVEDGFDNNITFDEGQQSANETSRTLAVNDDTVIEVNKDGDETVNSDESSRTMNVNVTESIGGAEETTLDDPASPSPKETKTEHGVGSVINNVRVWKRSSTTSSKGLARNSSRETPRKTNVGKNSSKPATPTTHSMRRTPKEVSKSEENLTSDSQREKKASESQPSDSKVNSRGIQEAKRLNRTVNSSSTKSEARPRAAAFSFKSSERAERRKEASFYTRLEEKMQAKEQEMNQMQAISQEKTEAEIKKFRRSLNFKATPMPSFYRTAVSPQSDGNKAISNNNKSRKVQNKPKCLGKTRNRNDQASDESVTASEPHSISASEACLISPSLSTSQSRSRLPDSKQIAKTPERRNEQRPSCKSRVLESSGKEGRRQKNNGAKQIGETPKRSNEITRKKSTRSIDVRSSSRVGNLTIHVAS
ncbi:protein WVD2-like 7 isoform X1 [Senna tora]|uniref:Protein WVD2-like 7 isoform X1 n=1 Tax=Senna tora TaxID=362788 RepID=A0A834TW96_9FABA|nr:protein WVD2-like 7 isoform X1 [Senna tora]